MCVGVCACVGVYTSVSVRLYVYMSVCLCVYVFACLRVCVFLRLRVRMRLCAGVGVYVFFLGMYRIKRDLYKKHLHHLHV